jgi:hypothetical protein
VNALLVVLFNHVASNPSVRNPTECLLRMSDPVSTGLALVVLCTIRTPYCVYVLYVRFAERKQLITTLVEKRYSCINYKGMTVLMKPLSYQK